MQAWKTLLELPWPRILGTAIDLAAPYGLLAWAWARCTRDPHRATVPRWQEALILLSLLLASAGAVMFGLRIAWRVRPGLLDDYLALWSREFLMDTLYVLLGGLGLSLVFARGLLRFLVAAACVWLTLLCLETCCGLMEYIQGWLDRLSAM
ncbi:MAG TPA: hypothetical protein VFQ07_14670 [Candidatus Polarisedimenticolia bacterium]|nr:hypothetical protein [Candidatus Polarisedimenticolia bacterium]